MAQLLCLLSRFWTPEQPDPGSTSPSLELSDFILCSHSHPTLQPGSLSLVSQRFLSDPCQTSQRFTWTALLFRQTVGWVLQLLARLEESVSTIPCYPPLIWNNLRHCRIPLLGRYACVREALSFRGVSWQKEWWIFVAPNQTLFSFSG